MPDHAGSDPLGLGPDGGAADPREPPLQDQPLFVQALWLPSASQSCGAAFAGFTASRGLRLVVQ